MELIDHLQVGSHLQASWAYFQDHLIIAWIPLFVFGLLVIEAFSRLKAGQLKNFIAALAGAGLLGWLDFTSLLILTTLSLFVFLLVRLRLSPKNFLYWLVLALMGFLIALKDNLPGFAWPSEYIPLGVSYYFFRLISFIIEYTKGNPKYREIKVDTYLAWVFFFPTFMAGPILRYHDFRPLGKAEQADQKLFNYCKFWLALSLKLLIVDHILSQIVYNELMMVLTNVSSVTILSIFGMLAFLHAYLDMMLYTAASQAVANYLGYSNVENFNRPFLATNISQYWLRWHISLSGWTKDYIFFPTLIKTRKVWLATYASMLIIGLWHGSAPNWIVWALLHGSAINFYSFIKQSKPYGILAKRGWGRKALALTGWAATMYFVSMAFVLIAFKDFRKPFLLIIWSLRSWPPFLYLLDLFRDAAWFQYLKHLLG